MIFLCGGYHAHVEIGEFAQATDARARITPVLQEAILTLHSAHSFLERAPYLGAFGIADRVAGLQRQ